MEQPNNESSKFLSSIIGELQSSNLSQDLILDTVSNYDFTLASNAARENTKDVPVYLEMLLEVALGVKSQLDALIGLSATPMQQTNTNTTSNFNTNNTTNTNTQLTDLNLPSLQNFSKGLLLKAIPSSFIRAYVGGIQKLFDEVSKLRLDKTAIEGIIEPLNMLTTSLDSITNFSLTQATIGLVKFKIFSKLLSAFFKNASSPENLKNSENLEAVAANMAPLETIGNSLTTFAGVKWVKSLLSVKTLKMFMTSLSKLPLAIVEKMTGVVKKIGDGLPKPLKKISDAIGDFGEKMGKVGGALIKGGLGILALSASLIPLSIGLKMFKGVDWKTVGVAGSALAGLSAIGIVLGKNMGATLKGALGIIALSASILPLAISLKMFQGINWDNIKNAGIVLGSLAAAAAILGIPKVAGLVAIGAGVIALLGASLIPLAYSLQKLSELDMDVLTDVGVGIGNLGLGLLKASPGLLLGGLAMIPFAAGVAALGLATSLSGDSITNFMEKFSNFSNALDPGKLFSAAKAIGALSVAIASFGAAQAIDGLGNLVGRLLRFGSDSPLEQLQKFADLSSQLSISSNAINLLAEGLGKLAAIKSELAVLANFPFDELEDLAEEIEGKGIIQIVIGPQGNVESRVAEGSTLDATASLPTGMQIERMPNNTGSTLNQSSANTLVAPVIVNNYGGNTTNNTTSSVNNTQAIYDPIMTGSSLGLA